MSSDHGIPQTIVRGQSTVCIDHKKYHTANKVISDQEQPETSVRERKAELTATTELSDGKTQLIVTTDNCQRVKHSYQ